MWRSEAIFMIKTPLLMGFLSGLSLLILYGAAMTFLSGWEAAVEQFQALWYLMVPLAAGFGIQVGLYIKLRHVVQEKAKTSLAAGGSSAGVSMLACCAHHATDALPFLGLSGVSILLTRYQVPILTVSLGINVLGIIVMLRHLKSIPV